MEATQTCHLGHKILECLKKRPDAICQIDAATGQSETNASVLSRSIRLANSLTALGLASGDVLALSGNNHLDIHIPFYAALFNGLPMLGVDPLYKFGEIKSIFKLTSPKIAFCEPKDYNNYVQAAQELSLDTKVFTFGDGPHGMNALIENGTDTKADDFKLLEFDIEKIYCWLVCTSGSTGSAKVAAFKHSSCFVKTVGFLHMMLERQALKKVQAVNETALNLSPIQWVSSIFNAVAIPMLGQTKVQTSAPLTAEHVIDIINKYRPSQFMTSPTLMTGVVGHKKPCDLTCLESIMLTGAKVPESLILELQSRMNKGAAVMNMHAQTEMMGPAILATPDSPPTSCGALMPIYKCQLVDPETEAVISEPNVPGELWVKGVLFAEYINNPEETAKAFSKDGWFKTGDLMYRDDSDNYYYVSRIKSLIKYQNYHVIPGELEEVIRLHPGVADVAVTSAPHPLDGEHPLACVVRKPDSDVTAQEIQDLVADKLSEKKQLRGGVVFLESLPLLSTGKVSIKELRRIADETINNKS